MQECIKKIVMSSMLFAAVMTFAAALTVSNVKEQQCYPWNGLMDIDYEFSGDVLRMGIYSTKVGVII